MFVATPVDAPRLRSIQPDGSGSRPIAVAPVAADADRAAAVGVVANDQRLAVVAELRQPDNTLVVSLDHVCQLPGTAALAEDVHRAAGASRSRIERRRT